MDATYLQFKMCLDLLGSLTCMLMTSGKKQAGGNNWIHTFPKAISKKKKKKNELQSRLEEFVWVDNFFFSFFFFFFFFFFF